MRKFLLAAGITASLALMPAIGSAALMGTGTDGEITVTATLEEVGTDLKFTLEVLGGAGDIRGFFMDIDPFAGVGGLDFVGADVTQVVIDEDNVINLGNGANMSGEAAFDIGVEIGTQGATPDFITMTMFSTDGGALTLSQFADQRWGFRATSTGADQENSAKIIGTWTDDDDQRNDIPEPGTMMLLGLGLIGLGVKARRDRK